jgi:hypothetical protein
MKQPRRWLLRATITLFFFLVGSNQASLAEPLPELAASSLSNDIQLYADTHQRSRLIRDSLQQIVNTLSHEPIAPSDLRPRLNQAKLDYFSVRAQLFMAIYTHAATVVEDRSSRPSYQTLGKIGLTLAAAADLVATANTIVKSVSFDETTRSLWNEQDEAHGIPAGSLEAEVSSDLSINFHDIFRAGLPNLDQHRSDLNRLYEQPHSDIRLLFPEGVDTGLRTIATAYRILQARVASADLTQDEKLLQALVDRAKHARMVWKDELSLLRDQLSHDGGIVRGNVHVRLNIIKRSFLTVREDLYPLAFKHVGIVSRKDIAYPFELRLRAIGLSLLAAGTLYENASVLQASIASIPILKELLNQSDPALGIPANFWDHIEREYTRSEYRQLFKAGLMALEAGYVRSDHPDPFLIYVGAELDALTTPSQIREEPLHRHFARAIRHYEAKAVSTGLTGLEQGKLQTSKGFGNFVGAFEFRKGKLYGQAEWVEFVKSRVRPGDILLEKTPFRVTDKFIPGHFGHVALYVGTEEQVKNLGLLREPSIAPHRTQLAEDRTIVEALREGTQINTIERFLNIDDLAILRPKPGAMAREDVLQAITLAFTHIGKKYDFGFDTNTWDTIVCSELAFQTYVNVRWPFGRTLGAYTISPDDVAVMAGNGADRPFQLISFVHDGQVVSDLTIGIDGEKVYQQLIEREPSRQTSLLRFMPNPSLLLKPFKSGEQ